MPKNVSLYEQVYNGKSLWELGKITEWEFSRISQNPELLKRTYFILKNVNIPFKSLIKYFK